jgi:hypothetical protein
MINEQIISWLLEGDVSVQFQTFRDLLDTDKPLVRKKIESQGWGLQFLSLRKPNGYWGRSFYQPKWISTHYTLLDLKNLNISPDNQAIKNTLDLILRKEKGPDGGILPNVGKQKSDVCVNGMVLNYASYFRVDEIYLKSVIDFLLAEKMDDGGFNCWSNTSGASHSSLHTTLSVLEGILEYQRNGFTYRLDDLENAKIESQEFILKHKLFLSDKTEKIIRSNFLKLYYPSRWYYDILKALDYFQLANAKYDKRMNQAFDVILNKRDKDGLWKLCSPHPGLTHFEMEQVGKPSRWNTLRAMRVFKHFDIPGF